MKISSRIIAKFLVLCGISLTCTACYAAPNTDYRPPVADGDMSEVVAVDAADDGNAEISSEGLTDISYEE